MMIHVQETLSKGSTTTFDEQIDVTELFKERRDVISSGPLHVLLRVTGGEGIITVEGELKIDLVMACSRCLNDAPEHIVIPIFETLKPASGKAEAETDEEEDDDVIIVEEDKIDLKPLVEEVLLLYLPRIPLCDNDCKGLCPNCGQNLNERQCGCSTDKIDPRFAALKDLFKE
ncbi:YceD family protein [Paenibacillus protaetiae]|uniref:DUF177 domain-containing protein n=1 Tax=Paenibacillus protaetiae TaxID=2509456 RepID=A0A4P6ET28_9BACL|nr:DUF177 domain-containing protein [Paenibacillus protaetiae]QAY65565.1 DUF177 domain-containing protein [Paenibacillus protaetiae]